MGVKDFTKTMVTTGAGMINPSYGLATVLLAEGMDLFYQSYMNVKKDKAQKFYDEFQKWLNLNLDEINQEFLEEPYFAEILELILVKASSTSKEWKVQKFKEILENRVKANKTNDYSKSYLDILDKLTENEFEILSYCVQTQKLGENNSTIEKENICKELNLTNEEYLLNVTHLEGKALIIERTWGRTSYNIISVSILGENFIKFVIGE